MATKKEIIGDLKKKLAKASPLVKGVFFTSGLKYKKKSELEYYLKRGRVTTHGDITMIKRQKKGK
jgi:hypothetical protein